ncbi:carbohydrate ABC transporter permease [Bogoriella caseilytica]|uniref:Carbohydrate ABC transporter membrane protein 1 (CUT1 family) n=1 Tax=Bogoriella caseilytica TaxID=56055 RepID=A0A3N2BEI5_9MICO|nr:sugar ABC transporter permease [Bogoriella caseilytica]ROR73454.1 carbohydrate ABC transporter membrane protein 1 (CUT1 family) [Bogoriella caseilytica]
MTSLQIRRPPAPATGAGGRRTNTRSSASRAEGRWGYLFLTPWFVGLVVLTAGPMLVSLYYSFTDFSLLSTPNWVGLDNYERMFTADDRFFAAVRVTLTYVIVSVPLQLAFALGIAVLLNRALRGISAYRALYYLPSLLGGSVAVAVLWRQVFGREGAVNVVLRGLGWENPPTWIADPDFALYTLILLRVWEFGSPMVIFLAGLRQVPQEYYEAAEVDGASPVQRFFRITIPVITPVIFLNAILQLIGAFQAFNSAFIISGGTGGPLDSTLFYTLYLYIEGFTNFRMGYASALAWVLLGIIAAFTAVNFALSRFWVHYEDGGR